MKILVVDDHPLVREGVRHALASLQRDIEVIEACDADEALEVAGGHPDLDLIMLDLGLPDMPGLAAMEPAPADPSKVNDLTRNEMTPILQEEIENIRDVFKGAKSRNRLHLKQPFHRFLGDIPDQVPIDRRRTQSIDGNVETCKFTRQHLRQTDDRGLRGRIGTLYPPISKAWQPWQS